MPRRALRGKPHARKGEVLASHCRHLPTIKPPMTTAPVNVEHNEAASRFEACVEGHLCVADYSLRDGTAVFTHTGVPPALQGRGIAAAMVRAALDWCAAQGHKVVPACSYVHAYMQRHPETQHLLAAR